MKNFILAATVLAFAGVSVSQAGTSVNNFALQDTVKQDTVKPADTAKKEYSYEYVAEQDTTKKENPTDTTKKEKQEYAYAAQYNNEQEPATSQPAPAQEEKREVKLDELPDAVKQTLTADIFKEWVPSTAFHITGEKEYYHIEVKKGEEVRNIKIGADGKVVE